MGISRSSLVMLLVACFFLFVSNRMEAQSQDQDSTVSYYVAPDGSDSNPGTLDLPLASLKCVRERVRELIGAGLKSNLKVIIREGTYELSEPLVFGPSDSGTEEHSITYSAYPRERVIISGGRKITGWKILSDNRWSAPLEKHDNFQQLYVEDKRAVHARIPNADSESSRWHLQKAEYKMPRNNGLPTSLTVTLAKGDLQKFSSIDNVQIVIFKDWATFRKQVAKIEPSKKRITLREPFVRPSTEPHRHNSLNASERQKGYTCYLEGSPDMIDTPGEWAINREKTRLEYYPMRGQDLDDFTAIYPVVPQLLVIKGTEDHPVRNLHFMGIRFNYAVHNLPDRGHDGRQAVAFYSGGWDIPAEDRILPAAIEWRYAQNCSLCGCRLSHVGANGLALLNGCQDNLIEGNHISDIGGNCVMVGTDFDPGVVSPALVRGNDVRNNWIHSGGRDYPSAVGVWLGFARSCSVSHNRIHDLSYTGISVGWQWNDQPSSSANNRIEYNYIFDVMKELGDGGAIYTLGYQPKTVLRGNHIHAVKRSRLNAAAPNNGFFFDEGSKGYLCDGNIVYDIAFSPIRGHKAKGVEISENILVYDFGNAVASISPPYGRPLQLRTNGILKFDGIAALILQNNEIYTERSWYKVSWDKIQQARRTSGIEREFRKILME